MWPERQTEMAEALRSSEGVLNALEEPPTFSRRRRVDVYRNNAIVNTRTHLSAVFPVVEMLLGNECFNEVARQFIIAQPPRSPVLIEYGNGFPGFLASSDVTRSVPYIGDVAALEWVRYAAYNAADVEPVDIEELSRFTPGEIEGLYLTLHPSCSLIESRWPIVSIWQAHQQADPASALKRISMAPEAALINRPALAVDTRAVGQDASALIGALVDGRTLGAALDAATGACSEDLSMCPAGAFACGVVVAASTEAPH